MFNLTNLITTICIATGMANTMPVCNTKKNANQIVNYTQTLTQQSANQTSYNRDTNNLGSVPSTITYTGTMDYETIVNYSSTSNYLNILATTYQTENMYDSGIDLVYVQNYATISENLDDYWKKTTTLMIVMQIDAYNYNQNTEITITNYIDIYNGNANPYIFEVNSRRFLKQVWYTTDNWANYIHRTIAPQMAYTIRSDIENVNNNFYYNKKQTLSDNITLTNNTYSYEDTTELILVPNQRNYVVIEYIPLATGSYEDVNEGNIQLWRSSQMIAQSDNYGLNSTNFTITGTNIIPDSNYEVIDIPGLMWEILTMPFAFVSQAFNLTLFPGTPYQLNISNLFLSILAIIVFVWLISFIIKLKG